MRPLVRVVLSILAMAGWPGFVMAQDVDLSVRALAAEEHRALVRIGPVLDDAALLDALQAGLPLRIRLHVELWRDELVDDLEDSQSFIMVMRYEPIEGQYLVYENRGSAAVRGYADYGAARTAVERAFLLDVRPRRSGRYYYLGGVEVETLALSDLEELENWLEGELRPAVTGERSVFSAIGQGAKRLLIRVLGLPAREVSARSEAFRVP